MAFYWTYKQKINARKPQYKNLSQKLGLIFFDTDDEGIRFFLRDVKIFQRGKKKKQINNIIFDDKGEGLAKTYFFDHHFVVSTGQSTRIFDQTVFFAQDKELKLPDFELKPKHFFHKVADYFGKKRVDLNDEYLNKNYLLYTESPKVLLWLNDPVFLKMIKQQKKLSIYGNNYHLVLYRHDKLAKLDQLEKTYHEYFSFYTHFKNQEDFLAE